MVDVEYTPDENCPVVEVVKQVLKSKTLIYRVSWENLNQNPDGSVRKVRKEKFFKTIEAAQKFAEARREAVALLGLLEGHGMGEPISLFLEDDNE